MFLHMSLETKMWKVPFDCIQRLVQVRDDEVDEVGS